MNKPLLALSLVTLVSACAPDQDAVLNTRAKQAVADFSAQLQGALQTALAEGGPAHAITVCSERAPEIAEQVGDEELTIRRIGTRVRNVPTDVPTDAERAILERFAALPEDARGTAHEEVVTDARYTYYAPIFVAKPVCLTCHGAEEDFGPELRAALEARYPDDDATGYQLGDLRGAFVVEIER